MEQQRDPIIEKYAKIQSEKLAVRIDNKLSLIVKPRPRYLPDFIYRLVIKEAVEILHEQEKHEWLIWSNEHGAYWKQNSCGYTQSFRNAGLYTFDEALQIVSDANKYCKEVPNEAMVPFAYIFPYEK